MAAHTPLSTANPASAAFGVSGGRLTRGGANCAGNLITTARAKADITKSTKTAAAVFGLYDWERLLSRGRTRWLAEIRFVAYYLAYRRGHSLHEIADHFGYHVTAVGYGVRKVYDLLATDKRFADKLESAERRMQNGR